MSVNSYVYACAKPDFKEKSYFSVRHYLSNKDYKKAIKHSDKVLKQKSDFMQEAYVTKGSALDLHHYYVRFAILEKPFREN